RSSLLPAVFPQGFRRRHAGCQSLNFARLCRFLLRPLCLNQRNQLAPGWEPGSSRLCFVSFVYSKRFQPFHRISCCGLPRSRRLFEHSGEVAPQLTEMEQAIANRPPCLQQTMYRQIALGHILSRPDLFLLRTFNRFRAYFCFPIHRGDPLVRYFHAAAWHRWLGIGITIVELCFYWPIMI